MSNNVEYLDTIPFFPETNDTVVAPTTGTQAQTQLICDDKLSTLQDLAARAKAAHDKFVNAISDLEYNNEQLRQVSPKIYAAIAPRLSAAKTQAGSMLTDIQSVCDATQMNFFSARSLLMSLRDFGTATPIVLLLQKDFAAIQLEAAQIKLESALLSSNTVVTETTLNKVQVENLPMSKILYDIELYLMLPGGKQVNLQQYIIELLYTRVFESSPLPIYSVLMSLPQTIVNLIKMHNEKIKWYLTVKAIDKVYEPNKIYKIPSVVIDNSQLIPVDPQFSNVTPDRANIDSGEPIYPFKIDLVPHKDTVLNSAVKSRVFKNSRMIDVIMVLVEELKAEYAARNESTSKEVKFSISPPDNLATYEQIMVEPGSFTKVINQLQTKYGIYNTGVRVTFDAIQSSKSGSGTESFTQVTVLGKGDIAPVTDAIKDVVIQLIDPRAIDQPFYDSGYYVDLKTGTMILRSCLPYEVVRNNSEALAEGESIRVMYSSSDDHVTSNCDNNSSDTSVSRMYWSRYSNPQALTSLQDSIREKAINITAEFRDLNVLTLNDNMSYFVKCYGEDDKVYTGSYRPTKVIMHFRNPQPNNHNVMESVSAISLNYIPTLRINGAEVPRQTYTEKLSKSATSKINTSSGYTKIANTFLNKVTSAVSSATGGKINLNLSKFLTPEGADGTGAPFVTNFAGRLDYYGLMIPGSIPDTWKMSPKVTLRDVYDTKDGVFPDLGAALCNNFGYFINAQRFAREIIEPCFNIAGGKGTKFNSWYRYGTSSGGAANSQHLIALAVDSTWGGAAGDSLCLKFYDLIQSGIEYDQLILEGDGTAWKWIHIGKQMNGANRQEVKLAFNAIEGQYKMVNLNKVMNPTDFNYSKALKVCF